MGTTIRPKNGVRGGTVTALCLSLAGGLSADIEDYGPVILEELASGLDQPIYVTAPPGDGERLFLVEQHGDILILDRTSGELSPEPFLSISPTSGGEQGLLGLAFHPDYGQNGTFYINFTGAGGSTIIRRYEVSDDPGIADEASGLDLLTFAQPFGNHNGGWMGFGPDGYLYIASGDGGGGNDSLNHAQRTETLLGAMLRIDVNGDDFPEDDGRNYAIPPDNPFADSAGGPEDPRPEIWAYGLRNPWRAGFDRETGDLWIADVGQSEREEINRQPADSPGGENYGWRIMEGTYFTGNDPGADPEALGLIDPIHEYEFPSGERRAVIGGYVYRGEAMPQLRGSYFYADYVDGFVRSLRYDGETVVAVTDWTDAFADSAGNWVAPSSFGEDAGGELYLTTLSGEVYRITQAPWHLWRNRHFTEEEIANPAISGDAASPAGDGVANLTKYALGLAPGEPGHPLPVETNVQSFEDGDFLAMTIPRNPEATDVAFIVEASVDLGITDPWSEEDLVLVESEEDLLVVRDARPAGERDRIFLRLRLERSP